MVMVIPIVVGAGVNWIYTLYPEVMVLRILGFWKDKSWYSTAEDSGWVSRIWSKQISLGLDKQKWVEVYKMHRAWRGVSIVWLA